jgi:hypothetical protein
VTTWFQAFAFSNAPCTAYVTGIPHSAVFGVKLSALLMDSLVGAEPVRPRNLRRAEDAEDSAVGGCTS